MHLPSTQRLLVVAAAALAARTAFGMGHLHADRPESYPALSPYEFGDGVMTYVVNLAGLRRSPNREYTAEQISRLEEAVARAFDTWNRVLAPLNLRFERLRKYRARELGVFTFDYERLIPSCWRFDSVAGAHSIPVFGLFFVPLPMILDNTEWFEDLAAEPVVVDRTLGHPYNSFTGSQALDIYSVALHEIGHILGLGHPSDSFQRGASFNFLALESVRIDPRCLAPSEFLGGEHIARRRPLLRTEVDSVMTPIQAGVRFLDIPPADRAFVAFALRYLNPAGADEMLAEARRLFLETSPLRFANVFEEHEKDPPSRQDNNTIEHAQPIEPNTIILGSIAVIENASSQIVSDIDVYRIDVTDQTAGATWYFDIDHGGGMLGPSWVDAKLELRDADGRTFAESDDTSEIDPGSINTVDPFLTLRFDSPGRYYVVVTGAPAFGDMGSSGDYELKIGVGGVPEPQGRRDVIPALADPSVAECLGTEPIDVSAVPCQQFGLLAVGMLAIGLPLLRRVFGVRPPRGVHRLAASRSSR